MGNDGDVYIFATSRVNGVRELTDHQSYFRIHNGVTEAKAAK